MEIVKYPNMTEICNNCKCEFVFEKEDVKTSKGLRNSKHYSYVNCPICNALIKVWEDKDEIN